MTALASTLKSTIGPIIGKTKLCDFLGYIENAGTPVSALVPTHIGQICFDTTNLDFYIAVALTNTDWAPMAFPDLSAAEINVLDAVTPGTGAVSKAMVLDSSGNIDMPDAGMFNRSADTLAAAGTSASDAAVVVDQVTIVTGSTGANGVALPAAADLGEIEIINDSDNYALLVYPVSGGNNLINELAEDAAFVLAPGTSCIFKAISATQWYAPKSASRPNGNTHFTIEDDFLAAAIDTTDNWIVFAGTDGDATAAATVTAPEGKVDMGSGDAGGTEDGSVMSLILLAKGSLVSLGMTVFECRVSFSQITGVTACFGLSDALATDAEHLLHTIIAGTVADGGLTVTNTVEIVYSEEATAGTLWHAASENAGTIGNSGAEETLVDGPTADTYDTLRIEVDPDGDARFYINGVLRLTRATAVATTSLLIPYIAIDGEAATPVVTDLSIDKVKFSGHRPSSNA